MGWQDRDYAREPTGWFFRRPGGSGYLIGGSIVTTLIAINVAIFVAEMLFPGFSRWLSGARYRTPQGDIIYGVAEMVGGFVLEGQVWRLFTAQYLHAGIGHVFINMLVLHFLGRPLETRWSPKKFFIVYTLCGLAGNIFFTLLASQGVIDPLRQAVGASGCIYGLLGIVAVLFPTATVYIYFLFPMRIRTAALIFGGIAFLSVVTRGSNFGGEACHLAGLVFGAWYAWKGEAWWRSTEWRIPGFKGGSGRRKRRSTFEQQVEERRADAETIDRILRKVYDGGIHSLSEVEKRALREATDRQRMREGAAGRVDRL